MANRVPEWLSPEYRHAYTAGWNSSLRDTDPDVSVDRYLAKHPGVQLGRGDGARDLEDAWRDGFEDHIAPREKWHFPACRKSGNLNTCDEH